jgi:hypothetical protein
MKKILFACDGDHFSEGAMDFIGMLHEKEAVNVKGIFLSSAAYHQLVSIGYVQVPESFNRTEQLMKARSEQKFTQRCQKAGIDFQVIDVGEEWDKETFARQTRFADLLVASGELFFSNYLMDQPNYYMQEMLHASECPVIIVPEKFKPPNHIIITYDGKKESMYALRQFYYLFPQMAAIPAEIVYLNHGENELPEGDLLKHYAALHLSNFTIEQLYFDAPKYFSAWASSQKDILVITGSFGRSALSELFKKSFAQKLIHDHKMPVFIAHA